MADMEEVIDHPFGEPKKVPLGYGAMDGATALIPKGQTKMEPSKEHDARMSALVEFFRFLVEGVEEDKLPMLGCRRTKEKDGLGRRVVRVCYNQ